MSFLAPAEEAEAMFGSCHLSTPSALCLGGGKQKLSLAWLEATLALWKFEATHLCSQSRVACARATISTLSLCPSDELGAKKKKIGFAKHRKVPGFSRW